MVIETYTQGPETVYERASERGRVQASHPWRVGSRSPASIAASN
jgi:hypothetical protein